FLAYEVGNLDFHRTTSSKLLDEITANLSVIQQRLDEMADHNTINSLQLNDQLEETKQEFEQYQLLLEKMVSLLLVKGFKDFGIEGKMRDQIHGVETELIKLDKPQLSVLMLTLRRHEKDYLLRKDLGYREKFGAEYLKFIQLLEKGNDNEQALIPHVKQYHELFLQLIQTDIQLGLAQDNGLRFQMGKTIETIESNLASITKSVEKASKKNINRIVWNLFILIAFSSLVIIYLFVRISRHIIRSISDIRAHVARLGHGELPDEIPIYNNDEIAHMKGSINELTKNLKNTRDFAEAVGNGNFEKSVDVFGNEGDLGKALVEMRQKLLQVSGDRERQMKESEHRLWANEGFSQLHAILGSNQQNNEDYYYRIISKMVLYLKANQGTIMVLEERNGDKLLVQKGVYAYDRNRINEKELKIGEGLIGAVAFEKQTLYMTQLPINYINITSGLGDAPPTNLVIVPCMVEDELLGIIELASFTIFEPFHIEFLERVAVDVASNIKKKQIEETTRDLLYKTQIQAKELAEKEEEMRQNLEELQATQEVLENRENELNREIEFLKQENHKLKTQINVVALQ
ncbi:MAG: HAMP domain-containing protein, partial [Salinivirgaceae bacterium]|nr:HAMP domain-containing protein [Salinivirgaceae bacterium]